MKFKNQLLMTLATAAMFTAVTSCKKYDNGGSKRKAEKNISNAWVIDQYLMDGVNQTSALLISGYVETFVEGGLYTRSYTDESGDPQNESGSWSLVDDKDRINVGGVGSYELTAETSTVSTSDYDIIKLTSDELWYSFENGGNMHEFHMKPQ